MLSTRSAENESAPAAWLSYLTVGRVTILAGLLVILFGGVRRADLTAVVTTVGVPLAALIGLSFIALSAHEVGVFVWLAKVVVGRSGNSALQLFTIVYFAIAFVDILFPNDATILLFAPLILGVLASLQHESWSDANWLPFLYAIVFGSNATSTIFVTSNSINMIFAGHFDLTYIEYARWMFVPSIASTLVCFGMMRLYFNKTLSTTTFVKYAKKALQLSPDAKSLEAKSLEAKPLETKASGTKQKYGLRTAQSTDVDEETQLTKPILMAICVIIGVFVSYFVLSALNIEYQYAIAVGVLVVLWPLKITPTASMVRVVKGLPWDEILFVSGMFILAFWVTHSRVAELLPWLFENLAKQSYFETVFGTTLVTAIGANFINDWPMATLSVLGLDNLPVSLGPIREMMIYTAVIGTNLGNKILPFGSLATLIWMGVIYRMSGVRVSWGHFIKVGLIVTPPTMLIAALVLWLEFIWWT